MSMTTLHMDDLQSVKLDIMLYNQIKKRCECEINPKYNTICKLCPIHFKQLQGLLKPDPVIKWNKDGSLR